MDTLASLRDERDEARETVQQLQAAMVPDPLPDFPGLSRSERMVLWCLMDGAIRDRRYLRARLDVLLGHSETDPDSLDVVICRLRRRGVDVETVRGSGWRLSGSG